MNNDIHYRYWTEAHRHALQAAGTSLKDMLVIALDVLKRMPPQIHLVSGPITTGGVGTIDGNLLVFRRVIELLDSSEGRNIFSQMPFENGMVAYHREWRRQNPTADYCWPILYEFYEGLFDSGKFHMFHFIHGYEASVGAVWEHAKCDQMRIRKRYLPRALSTRILCEIQEERAQQIKTTCW